MSRKGRLNWRLVKIHHSYTVDEAARLLGRSKGTVRRWLKAGLTALTDRKPILILGGDLADFLKGRAKPRARCGPGQCFCFRCRAPRNAAYGMADVELLSPASGSLQALCSVCGTIMYRRISLQQLGSLRAILDVSIMDRGNGLGDTS